jgi:hypothetical protein
MSRERLQKLQGGGYRAKGHRTRQTLHGEHTLKGIPGQGHLLAVGKTRRHRRGRSGGLSGSRQRLAQLRRGHAH